MTTLASSIISQVRTILQDVPGVRYSTADLLIGINDFIKIIRELRPDAFFGQYSTAISDIDATGAIPIADKYSQAIRDYVVGFAMLREREDAAKATAANFMQKAVETVKTI